MIIESKYKEQLFILIAQLDYFFCFNDIFLSLSVQSYLSERCESFVYLFVVI